MTEELTDFDKKVYNLWLSSTRSCVDKPFKYRKSFDKLEDERLIHIKRLSSLFVKTPHLMRREYFEAPYKLYGKDEYFPLKYFSTFKCISTFNRYMKTIPNNDLDFIANSFKYIYTFCKDRNILLNEYPFYKSISQFDFLKHIKDHYVSPYVACCFTEMYLIMVNLEPDVYHLYFGDLDVVELERKYSNNAVIQKLCNSLKDKVSQKMNKI